METISYYDTADKSSWPDGPWKTEPDKKQWRDPATGLPCLIVRNRLGALCGYVGVPEEHPLHGKSYDAPELPEITCHGGLTYSAACSEGPAEKTICHIPAEGEPDSIWWFGFDCLHAWDAWPTSTVVSDQIKHGYPYRDIAYVEQQVADLAKQLKDLS